MDDTNSELSRVMSFGLEKWLNIIIIINFIIFILFNLFIHIKLF